MGTETTVLTRYETHNTSKPHIPVVDHVITDDQHPNTVVLEHKVNPLNVAKVYKLLTDKHSDHLVDRHVKALRNLAKRFSLGFPVKDIVLVYKILNVCTERLQCVPEYEEPLIQLIQLCGQAYLKEKASDDIVYKQMVVESISHLGYLMRIPSPEVRRAICRTLVTFYCDDASYNDIKNYQPTSLQQKQTAISDSDVAETMVKSLSLLENDEQLMEDVLVVLERFSNHAANICNQMLSVNAAYTICSQLTRFDPAGKTIFISVNILWNLLDIGNKLDGARQLSNVTCINQLRDSFLYQLTQGYSHYHRQLRNDFLTLANLVASQCPNAPFMETGFLKQLCVFATFQEVKCHSILVKHLKLEANPEDFELKKLLITIIVQLASDPSVLPVLREGNVMLALFSYVRANENIMSRREWSPAQFEELQLLAMSSLCVLCPIMLPDYLQCQGSTRLLLLLEWCVSPDEYGGHGNSFHGTGGRGNKRAQMRHCLRLLRAVVSTGHVLAIQDLVDQGAILQITAILTNAIHCEVKDDGIDIEMQSDMLAILSCLCDDDVHNKELFGTEGVDVVVSYLKMEPKLITSGIGHNWLLVAAIDVVWSCVSGCGLTEEHFMSCQGICLLLDLLEYIPKVMQNMVLGCILDLSDNPKTWPHLLIWRGKGQRTMASLLCEIWRVTESDIGVERDAIGAIENTDDPLISQAQKDKGTVPLPANLQSAAIVDVSENMRSKIFTILSKIGFSESAGLPVQDYITLTIIERYLDLKMGQVWNEIKEELSVENIRPITPDDQAMTEIMRAIKERNTVLNMTQVELNEAQNVRDIEAEERYYQMIKDNHKQREKAISDFQDFVYRTSNYEYLKEAKCNQKLAVDGSRMSDPAVHENIPHHTEVKNVQITTFSGVGLKVNSTPVSITGGNLANYDPQTGENSPRNV